MYGDVLLDLLWSFEFWVLESCFLVLFCLAGCLHLVSILLMVVGGYEADFVAGGSVELRVGVLRGP